jgi:hypothetical protein
MIMEVPHAARMRMMMMMTMFQAAAKVMIVMTMNHSTLSRQNCWQSN